MDNQAGNHGQKTSTRTPYLLSGIIYPRKNTKLSAILKTPLLWTKRFGPKRYLKRFHYPNVPAEQNAFEIKQVLNSKKHFILHS